MDLARVINSKKFMWDGYVYKTKEEAEGTAQKYRENGFEAELIKDVDQYFVFTRRVVKEIVIEWTPM